MVELKNIYKGCNRDGKGMIYGLFYIILCLVIIVVRVCSSFKLKNDV